jgi:hypothetical protein
MKSMLLSGKTAFSLSLLVAVGGLAGSGLPAQAEIVISTPLLEEIVETPVGWTGDESLLSSDALDADLVQISESELAIAQDVVNASLEDDPPAVHQASNSSEMSSEPSIGSLADASFLGTEPISVDPAEVELDDTTAPRSADDVLSALETERRLGQQAPQRAHPSMSQLTSVSQLSDVQPTDWAFQALQSLVERYGCIVGYPDGTFRGDRGLTRYEFAAGLNACMDRINELIGGALDSVATRQDLETLQRLQEEFAAELATLRGRVDALEARVSEVEANQFSTTTKLFGQVVVGIQDRNDNTFEFFRDEFEDEANANVITNVQLNLITQFSPRSILLTGLQAGSGSTATGRPALTNFVGLSYEGDTGDDFEISDLTFRQLVTDDLAVIVGAVGVSPVNVFRGANRVESAGFGPLSRFAQRNPIISIGSTNGGVGFDWQIASRLSFQGVYSVNLPGNPIDGGIFGGENGTTAIGAQLVVSPTNDIDIAFQYVNSYSPFGLLGTGVGDDQLAVIDGATSRAPIQTNAFGSSLEWRITSGLTLGGWFGYTTSDLLGESGSVETINWMAYLNFPDLLGEGNLAGLYFGQPTRIVNSDLPDGRNIPALVNEGSLTGSGGQPSSAFHVEGFYRLQIMDNLYITPGVIAIFNPGHNSDNDTIVIGAIRTTFTF